MVRATVTPLRDGDPASNLKLRGDIIRGLQQNLIHGGHSLGAIPDDIKLIVDKDMWREWVDPVTGEVREYASFEEFARAPFTEGLNADVRSLKNLCRDDLDALRAIDKALSRGRGRPKNVDNIHVSPIDERPSGTSRQRALRRLRKDRPDLHERVLVGEISPHAAMVEAGFRKKTVSIPLEPRSIAATLRRYLTEDQLEDLIAELAGGAS